ncbi:MAG: ABC transporter ATP-binding protein [Pseudomonadota bacterium]
MTLLKAHSVSRQFGGLKAVDGVDFELQQGEIRAIIGPNGAGKTTFVSLLCGRLEVSDGRIVFDQEDITNLPAYQRARRGIAYTFQITSIYPRLTAYENVAIAAQNALQQDQSVHERAVQAMESAGIAHLGKERAGDLAYGHQRVLEVTMGLAMSPRLLILDEPTQGLSDGEIDQFCRLVRQVSERATVLLIEHNMQVVMTLAQTITVMDQGRILAQGRPEEIQNDAAVQAAYLGT